LFFSALCFFSLKAQPSRIELRSHYSPVLGTMKEFNLFFPEGYDSETDRYPVVHLFRGAVDEWADPFEDASRRGNIKTVFDSLYAKKKTGKMILIMPGLGAPASQSEYVYLVNDLIPYIDANFRTIPDRWHRTMDGFSLGGSIVTNLLASDPQLFCSVGSYDGTLNSPYFENTKFSTASNSLIYSIKQIQLLYHTASIGGNNNSNNQAVFNILNGKGISNSLPSFLLDPSAQHNWYFADLHVSITLPLHWQRTESAKNNLNLSLKKQFTGQTISGTTAIDWSRIPTPDSLATFLFYSVNNGKNWTNVHSTKGNDSSFQWNTIPLPDGTRYKVKIISAGDSLFGSAISGTFTVNNPGNGAPDVEFTNLAERDTLTDMFDLKWTAGDADGDAVTITLEISCNAGSTWSTIASSVTNTGHFSLDTKNFANSNSVLFRLTGSDGTVFSQAVSPAVIIYNKRINLTNAIFVHQSGYSDAVIRALGMSIDVLHSAQYTVTFSKSAGKKSYSVFNTKGIEVVKGATELDGKTEGPLFDGFRLLIKDFPFPMVNNDSSRWINGSSNLVGEVRLIDINTESGTVTAVPFASDYEIRLSSAIVDTSLALYGASAQPVNFLVWNTTLNRKTKFIYSELDGNGILSEFDELYLMEKDSINNYALSWHVQFAASGTAVNPISGDKFRIKVLKPLTGTDSYHFIYTPPNSVKETNGILKEYSLSQNYPNPFNPATTIDFFIPDNEIVSLTVFDILGRTMETLLHQKMPAGQYSYAWNAGRYPSGVYFYRLRTASFTQTRKMIVTK
jgi:hypothetical protein